MFLYFILQMSCKSDIYVSEGVVAILTATSVSGILRKFIEYFDNSL